MSDTLSPRDELPPSGGQEVVGPAVVTGTVTSSGDEAQGVFPVAAARPLKVQDTAGPPLTAAELIAALVLLRGREILKLHGIPSSDDLSFGELTEERQRVEAELRALYGAGR
jgi:hypothetical protein